MLAPAAVNPLVPGAITPATQLPQASGERSKVQLLAMAGDDLVAGLMRHLERGLLLLWDRNFFSYELWQAVTRKAHLLARVKAGLILEPVQTLADGSYLARTYRNACDRPRGMIGAACTSPTMRACSTVCELM